MKGISLLNILGLLSALVMTGCGDSQADLKSEIQSLDTRALNQVSMTADSIYGIWESTNPETDKISYLKIRPQGLQFLYNCASVKSNVQVNAKLRPLLNESSGFLVITRKAMKVQDGCRVSVQEGVFSAFEVLGFSAVLRFGRENSTFVKISDLP